VYFLVDGGMMDEDPMGGALPSMVWSQDGIRREGQVGCRSTLEEAGSSREDEALSKGGADGGPLEVSRVDQGSTLLLLGVFSG